MYRPRAMDLIDEMTKTQPGEDSFPFPAWIVDRFLDRDLSLVEMNVALAIGRWTLSTEGQPRDLSVKEIQKETGFSPSEIALALSQLKSKGVLYMKHLKRTTWVGLFLAGVKRMHGSPAHWQSNLRFL